ncbi:MAG: EamA family transporter [Actinomycetota bacterium]|nr:EamA family transporter [Actinomycetota bacterium]
MPQTRPRLGYGLVIFGAVLFGVNGAVSRVAMRAGISPESLTTLRITGATLVFALAALIWRRSALRPPTGSSLLLIAALGLVGVASLQLTYNIAINRLPLGIALLIEYLAPVLVVLWVRFIRGEQVRNRMWSAVALSLVGIATVGQVWMGLDFDTLGIIMGLAAAVSFASYFLLGEHNVGFDDPLRIILWAFAFATVVMNVIAPIWKAETLSVDASLLGNLDEFSLPLLLLVGWIILLGTVAPFFLQLIALQHIPATVVTVIATLEPVIAVVLGWAWFTESLNAVQVVGGVLVLAGIGLAQSARREIHTALPPQ